MRFSYLGGYILIVLMYWGSLVWRFNEFYPASYLLGKALVWPAVFVQWVFS